jgi:hypothetical protein
MGIRGRKSLASLAVVRPISDSRPQPPPELTEEQSVEWLEVTRRLPTDYFPRETHAMLAAFCRHVVAYRMLSKTIDEFEPTWMAEEGGLERLDRLGKMRDREGRALSSLATRLRLSPQSRMHQRSAARAADRGGTGGPRPWDQDFKAARR